MASKLLPSPMFSFLSQNQYGHKICLFVFFAIGLSQCLFCQGGCELQNSDLDFTHPNIQWCLDPDIWFDLPCTVLDSHILVSSFQIKCLQGSQPGFLVQVYFYYLWPSVSFYTIFKICHLEKMDGLWTTNTFSFNVLNNWTDNFKMYEWSLVWYPALSNQK